MNSNPEEASAMIAEAGLAGNAAVAKSALPRCNITYLDGADMRTALEGFWSALFALDPKSVGGKLPDSALTAPIK